MEQKNERGLERGIEYFKGITKDANFALAYTGLSDSYYLLSATGFAGMPASESVPLAKAAALKALEIDETLAEAHASMASVYSSEYDWARAEREYRRSVELNPAYATVRHWHAFYLAAMGRTEEAVAEGLRARNSIRFPSSSIGIWHSCSPMRAGRTMPSRNTNGRWNSIQILRWRTRDSGGRT